MADVYRLLLALHVVVAFAALAAFWVAVLSRKGGQPHRGFGGIFVYSMAATAATAGMLCVVLLVDPMAARPPGPEIAPQEHGEYATILRDIGSGLLEQSLLAGALLHFGWTALRRRRVRSGRAREGDVMVAGAAAGAGVLLLAAGLDGILLTAIGALELRALLRRERPPWAWLTEHVAGMLGAGGIANGAFAVNVARHFTDDLGLMFAPGGVVGLAFVVVIVLVSRRVRRGYGVTDLHEFAHPGVFARAGRV